MMHSASVMQHMATLHVRNVPDDLYELLRERAEASDRSIGAETIQLLHERLALLGVGPMPWGEPPPGFPRRSRRRPHGRGPHERPMLARFTPNARRAVVAAQEAARALGHDHVGSDHLLLGVLLQEGAPIAGQLAERGLTAEKAREAVERRRGRGEESPAGRIPFDPAAKQALELALRESVKLGHTHVGCEHLALGVLDQESGAGAAIFGEAGIDDATLRSCVERTLRLAPQMDMLLPAAQRAFRVLLLEGEAADWEKQLNDLAQLGYDLVEIVGERAILRLGWR